MLHETGKREARASNRGGCDLAGADVGIDVVTWHHVYSLVTGA
jgi:hypothetical protein